MDIFALWQILFDMVKITEYQYDLVEDRLHEQFSHISLELQISIRFDIDFFSNVFSILLVSLCLILMLISQMRDEIKYWNMFVTSMVQIELHKYVLFELLRLELPLRMLDGHSGFHSRI